MNDRSPIFIKPALEQLFLSSWGQARVILFSAPCGCGKTATALALLHGHSICMLDSAASQFTARELSKNCDVVLADDLQYLTDPDRQKALCELIRTRPDLHFVLLGRCRLPGWLMPFQFAGILLVIDTEALLFDRASTQRMLEACGHPLSPAELSAVQRDFRGYPLALNILCRKLAPGMPYTAEANDSCRLEIFFYYDEAVYRRFEQPLRRLMVSVAPFEHFSLELAKMISGDPDAGERLGTLQRESSMLLFDSVDTCHFWPVFRDFLMWEFRQELNEADQRALYSRAALYYELHGELRSALDCYVRAGQHGKVSELLVKNADQHPGAAHYLEMESYYFSLPREEVLRSPSLMCGMSMLSALCLDYEASEEWYRELQNYAARLKRTDTELQTVQGKLVFLDISLPQRGSHGLIEVIGSVFRAMTDRKLNIPSFSVTSMLPSIMNGGKDFCEWSKKDELLFATMRRPVEAVLGRDGIGLADCAICESKFEKGEDISRRLLTLMSRLGEIQAKGTPDIEFAVVGLLARVQISQGKARAALESIENLRAKFSEAGQTRFLPNIDAMLCRIHLYVGDREDALLWLHEKAPRSDVRLWAMWRYRYLTQVLVLLSEDECRDALLVLARLLPFCERCGRTMDGIYIRLLSALCRSRMGDDGWKAEMCDALDRCCTYSFVWPVAQYGAAVLPLLQSCGWKGSPAYLDRLLAAARAQAVHYPRLMKPPTTLAEPLSAAETQVLKLLCENLSNQEIGDLLGIRLPTVKTHVSHILQKLNVARRSEARDAAVRLHLI